MRLSARWASWRPPVMCRRSIRCATSSISDTPGRWVWPILPARPSIPDCSRPRRQRSNSRGSVAWKRSAEASNRRPMETRCGIESQGAPVDEPSLVDRARHDPDAFGELYERYCDRIYRFASTRLKGCVDAEDLTAEVFFRAFRGIKTYRNAGRPFGAWLFRIEINALAERSRRQ